MTQSEKPVYYKDFMSIFPDIFGKAKGAELAVYLFLAHKFCTTKGNKSIRAKFKEMSRVLSLSYNTLTLATDRLAGKKLISKQSYTMDGNWTLVTYKVRHPSTLKIMRESVAENDTSSVAEFDDSSVAEFDDSSVAENATFSSSSEKIASHFFPQKNENGKKERKDILPLLSNNGSSNKQEKDRYTKAAECLIYNLKRHSKGTRNPDKRKYASIFKRYIDDGNQWNRFKEVLKWYCNNLDKVMSDQYSPRAYSAKTFIDKFDRIEDYIQRSTMSGEEQSNFQQQDIYYPPPKPEPTTKQREQQEQARIKHLWENLM